MNEPASLAGDVKNRRTRLIQGMLVFGSIALVCVVFIIGFIGGDEENRADVKLKEPLAITRIDDVAAEDVWISTGETRLGEAESRLKALETMVEEAVSRNASLGAQNSELKEQIERIVRDAKVTIDEQAAVINGAGDVPMNDPFAVVPGVAQNISSSERDPFANGGTAGAAVTPTSILPVALEPTLVRFTLSERNASSDAYAGDMDAGDVVSDSVKDVKRYVPAGAHARAIIVAGAAAPVGVSGQSDPRPVLIRLVGSAYSAAQGRGKRLKSAIGGCTITGEARGDLSSERVYVRLQTMTCQHEGGVIETPVQGFVAGTGQAGVRGEVISREGNLVEKSALAGILSGFGSSVSEGLRPPVIRDGDKLPENSVLLDNAFKSGLGQGIGNAGDRLAQYYISRAEQYQPVVSLKGGTPVEVVFLAGAWLDGRVEEPEDNSDVLLGGLQ